MADSSETQSNLSPCSSFESLDSLRIKGKDIDLGNEQCQEVDGQTLVQIALDIDLLSQFY